MASHPFLKTQEPGNDVPSIQDVPIPKSREARVVNGTQNGVVGNGKPHKKEYRVALTGFGPFANFPINPSWQCLKELDGTVHKSANGHKVAFDCFEISTTYEQVLDQVPILHGLPSSCPQRALQIHSTDHQRNFDFFVHCGVASSRDFVSIETRARRYGYRDRDASGQYAPSTVDLSTGKFLQGLVGEEWAVDHNGELGTLVDVETIARGVSLARVKTSDNAGLFLCEFIYYTSLACAKRVAGESHAPQKPVIFVHIPPQDQPYSLVQLTHIIQQIVLDCVDSIGTG